jgi:hypothetical protein
MYYLGTCLEGLMKTMETLTQDIDFVVLGSNAIRTCRQTPMFPRNILSPSLGLEDGDKMLVSTYKSTGRPTSTCSLT